MWLDRGINKYPKVSPPSNWWAHKQKIFWIRGKNTVTWTNIKQTKIYSLVSCGECCLIYQEKCVTYLPCYQWTMHMQPCTHPPCITFNQNGILDAWTWISKKVMGKKQLSFYQKGLGSINKMRILTKNTCWKQNDL